MDSLQQTYDDIPYPSLSYTQTHPDHLATIATILGMAPAPVNNCRVLEIGCASGGNLIPMAVTLPHSQFVGIDFSLRQIAAGQRIVEALDISNIRLLPQNILDITAELGQFDYIIAHGIYSWVPPQVRDKLLQVCAQNLAPQGIAYVSYNTYPGWHMMGALRHMMLFHTRHAEDGQAKITAARELLQFLGEAVPSNDQTFRGAYGTFIKAYGKFVEDQRQETSAGHELLLHDELELFNEPVYFHDFMAHAAQHGLQYVAEADFAQVMMMDFDLPVRQKLMEMAQSTIELEQYMDFLRNRTLRQTLLCHETVSVNRRLQTSPELMQQFFVASWASPTEEDVDILRQTAVRFQTHDGATLTTDHPLTKAAFLYLRQMLPTAVSFKDLVSAAQAHLGNKITDQDIELLGVNLLRGYSYDSKLVELHTRALPFTTVVSDYPSASFLARYQVESNLPVVNQRHERIILDKLSRFLLPHLDGTRSHEDLLALLMQLVEQGIIEIKGGEGEMRDTAVSYLKGELQAVLHWLAKTALLIA